MLLACTWFANVQAETPTERSKSTESDLNVVRVVYLVSRDRTERPEYTAAIEQAIVDLQKWYAGQLGGATFRLHSPIVEVIKSPKPAVWFHANPAGEHKENWGYNNTFAEASELVGAKHNDPHITWVIYSDSPGNSGRGGSGVACMPEDDLLGLVGKHPTQKDKLRWVAGLGHELGHAFGLPHPADTVKDADAIMWTGIYGKYPDRTYLTDDDKKILSRSPFFYNPDDSPVYRLPKVVARYSYPGGAFLQHSSKSPTIWTETKTDSAARFTFEESKRENGMIYIDDRPRGIKIRFPSVGGHAELSADSGTTWNRFSEFKLDE
ncbi:hypothetical protein CGZ80_08170 [Rhodopirellula sp. MGV]|nr:hypothetical protein CGZ80_08170 [Rhodopirellula sp. MGV]PNY34570.1 hypothetical protein C2E31_22985 [Rhodopirellula baltica]